MVTIGSIRVCLVLALAVSRVASAGQAHKGVNQALRIQAAVSKDAEMPTKEPPKTESQNKTKEVASMDDEAPLSSKMKFKMPLYSHVDSLSAATNGFLDWFVVAYWGIIVLFVVAFEVFDHYREHSIFSARRTSFFDKEHDGEKATVAEEPAKLGRTRSFLAGDVAGSEDILGEEKDKTLAPNIWSLSLVASHGKAKDRRGNILSPWVVFIAGVIMGLIQLLTLFLVVYDIDPTASPYTSKPGAPWKTSPFTVNCMKVVMVFFLGMYVVSEAADAYDNFILGLAMKGRELLIHWSCVLSIPVFHYLITLCVILAGVSVVLSCQDVPNILYNSMAILFITRVDELFWGFFERTFDIEADWNVQIQESDVVEVQLIKKCIIMFPMLWGFCLLGRAWYRDQMPAIIVRVLASSHMQG